MPGGGTRGAGWAGLYGLTGGLGGVPDGGPVVTHHEHWSCDVCGGKLAVLAGSARISIVVVTDECPVPNPFWCLDVCPGCERRFEGTRSGTQGLVRAAVNGGGSGGSGGSAGGQQ